MRRLVLVGVCVSAGCFEESAPVGPAPGDSGATGAGGSGTTVVVGPDGSTTVSDVDAGSETGFGTVGLLELYPLACTTAQWGAGSNPDDLGPSGCDPLPMPGWVTLERAIPVDGDVVRGLRLVPPTAGEISGLFANLDTSAYAVPQFFMPVACAAPPPCRFDVDVVVASAAGDVLAQQSMAFSSDVDGPVAFMEVDFPPGVVSIVLSVSDPQALAPPGEHALLIDPIVVDLD